MNRYVLLLFYMFRKSFYIISHVRFDARVVPYSTSVYGQCRSPCHSPPAGWFTLAPQTGFTHTFAPGTSSRLHLRKNQPRLPRAYPPALPACSPTHLLYPPASPTRLLYPPTSAYRPEPEPPLPHPPLISLAAVRQNGCSTRASANASRYRRGTLHLRCRAQDG